MKYHKITWKETSETEECSSFKTACNITGLHYQSQLNLRSKTKIKTIDNKKVKIEQLQMRK
jgi:hypothetical protein